MENKDIGQPSNGSSRCTSFNSDSDDYRCLVILTVKRATATFSLIGCVFMLFVIWLLRRYHSLAQKMILSLTVAALFDSVAYVMGEDHQEGGLCTFQAWWLMYFGEFTHWRHPSKEHRPHPPPSGAEPACRTTGARAGQRSRRAALLQASASTGSGRAGEAPPASRVSAGGRLSSGQLQGGTPLRCGPGFGLCPPVSDVGLVSASVPPVSDVGLVSASVPPRCGPGFGLCPPVSDVGLVSASVPRRCGPGFGLCPPVSDVGLVSASVPPVSDVGLVSASVPRDVGLVSASVPPVSDVGLVSASVPPVSDVGLVSASVPPPLSPAMWAWFRPLSPGERCGPGFGPCPPVSDVGLCPPVSDVGLVSAPVPHWITDSHVAWRFGIWYVPLFTLIFLMICCYARIIYVANKRMQSWFGTFNPERERRKVSLAEEIRPLKWYPSVYLLVSLFPLINRLHNASYPREPVFSLTLLHVLSAPLHGLANAVVFGLDKDTWGQLSLTGIQLALRSRLCDRTQIREYHPGAVRYSPADEAGFTDSDDDTNVLFYSPDMALKDRGP
ncbi:uncharacterized protein si:dkey-100n23.5 [Anguilla anguilla]|uniref:uncharacterized protein si:dkey-100n23.5 n=1 Tax=Anguilla anguilla TaxID=7936 RepID=UPI0015AC7FBC|nr:uncharacterized protein si:dkey-100n23.5 [Anguilla anguilla]